MSLFHLHFFFFFFKLDTGLLIDSWQLFSFSTLTNPSQPSAASDVYPSGLPLPIMRLFFCFVDFLFWLCFLTLDYQGFHCSSVGKESPAVQETQVWSLGWEDPLEKERVNHSSILAWKISQTEEPGGLQSMGLQRVRHNWVTNRQHVMSGNSISSYLEFTEFLRCRLILFIRFDKFSAIAHVKLDIFSFFSNSSSAYSTTTTPSCRAYFFLSCFLLFTVLGGQ